MILSHAHGPSHVPLLSETIGECPGGPSSASPDREALVVAPPGLPRDLPASCGARSTGPRARCSRAASAKGDRVGIWAPNRHEWVITQFATARIGAILVTINPPTSRPRSATPCRKAGVSLLVSASSTPPSRAAPCPALRSDRPRRRLGGASWPRATTSPTPRSPSARRRSSRTTRSTSSSRRAPPGAPKGATLTHRNILNNAHFIGRRDALHRTRPRVRSRPAVPPSGW